MTLMMSHRNDQEFDGFGRPHFLQIARKKGCVLGKVLIRSSFMTKQTKLHHILCFNDVTNTILATALWCEVQAYLHGLGSAIQWLSLHKGPRLVIWARALKRYAIIANFAHVRKPHLQDRLLNRMCGRMWKVVCKAAIPQKTCSVVNC